MNIWSCLRPYQCSFQFSRTSESSPKALLKEACVFFDDILIYRQDKVSHKEHLEFVLEVLWDN